MTDIDFTAQGTVDPNPGFRITVAHYPDYAEEVVAETLTFAGAWWTFVEEVVKGGSLASPETMERLRRDFDNGSDVFCNGYSIHKVDALD